MANRHVKTINGRKYYYESIRKGKKVTSRYIGPVDERKRKTKINKTEETETKDEIKKDETQDETYIG